MYLVISYSLFFVSFLDFLLGILSLKNNPRNSNINKTLAVISIISCLWSLFPAIVYLRAGKGLDFNFAYRACWIGWLAVPAALQFAYYLEDEKSRLARNIGFILYPFWVIVFILCLTTDLVEQGVYSLIPYRDRYGPLERPMRLFGTILLFWGVYKFYKIRKKATGIKKLQLNYFLFISMFFSIGSACTSGLLQLFGGFGFDPALTAYFSVFWVAFTFYAITRYRLFDIQIIISRSIVILILLLIVTVIHTVIFKILEPFFGPVVSTLVSFSFIGFLVSATPLINKLQRNVNGLILKDKYDYQNILKEFTKAIVTILDSQELLYHLIETIKKSLRVERIYLFLKDRDESFHSYFEWQLNQEPKTDNSLDPKLIQWLMNNRQIFIREEFVSRLPEERYRAIFGKIDGLKAELVAPMFFKEQLIGVLILGSKGSGDPYMQSDIDILESLAAQTAIAIENARLYNEAITDSLTGVYHHKYFLMRLKEERGRAKRYNLGFGIVMIDIDHFKEINDTRGHLVGDAVLQEAAGIFKRYFRLTDIIARYGGDEFIVLLPNTPREGLISLAERIRSEFEKTIFKDGNKITVSIGAWYYSPEKDSGSTDEEIIKKVDTALYQAKQMGRNRVEVIS